MTEEEMERPGKVVVRTETKTREDKTSLVEDKIERIDQRGVIGRTGEIKDKAKGKKMISMKGLGGTEVIGMVEETGETGETGEREETGVREEIMSTE